MSSERGNHKVQHRVAKSQQLNLMQCNSPEPSMTANNWPNHWEGFGKDQKIISMYSYLKTLDAMKLESKLLILI